MKRQPVTDDMLLPELIRQFPATRAVLDRYGLHGCGGPEGPNETVAWFARLHGIPLDTLLEELNRAASDKNQGGISYKPSRADTIYRPFFLAGLATLFTLGCLMGAVNLWLMATRQSFSGVDYSWVLAHGHAMVFGFVGFFVMGFAYQAFPRFKHTQLWQPNLALWTLPLMALGIIFQAAAHILAPRPPFLVLGFLAGGLQITAVAIFILICKKTFQQSGKQESYDGFVFAALFWFLLAALANPVIFWLFETAYTREQFLFRVATFNIPYRDIQLLGIAVMMILGVSLRFLPHAYGMREPAAAWRRFMFWGVNGALVFGSLTFLAGRLTGSSPWFMGPQVATLILLIIAVGLPRQYRLFGNIPENERDRGLKFIRTAHLWFIVAMVMLFINPIYNVLIYQPLTGARAPFSHAFFGAYRHALTVGFIMMMIVGVSSKIVPTLSGVDVRKATALWPTFILLNLGNFLRVSTEIATDFTPSAYAWLKISGFIEVAGLALWGYELLRNMRFGKQLERQSGELRYATTATFVLTPQTKVAEVLARYPDSLAIFLKHGFTPLQNPVLRRTMARVVTLEQACRRENVNLRALLDDLNAFIREERITRLSSTAKKSGKLKIVEEGRSGRAG